MRNLLTCLLTGMFIIVLTSTANAFLIDFESSATGTYNSLTIGNVTFTSNPGSFQVVDATPGPPISNHSLISYFDGANPIVATFATPVNSVKVGVGDFDQDEDNSYLYAYDASHNLITQDYFHNLATTYGGGYLQVSSTTPISYVVMDDKEPFPMAVYWDNFEYDAKPVPVPAAVYLLGSGLMGLVGWRKKFVV
jgi:hypothetical protein